MRTVRSWVSAFQHRPRPAAAAASAGAGVHASADGHLAPDAHQRLWAQVGMGFAVPALVVVVGAILSASHAPAPPRSHPKPVHGGTAPAVATAGPFAVTGHPPLRLLPRKAVLYAISRMGSETLTYRGQPAARLVARTAALHNGRVTLVYDLYPSLGFLHWNAVERRGAALAMLRKTLAQPASLMLGYAGYYYRYTAQHPATRRTMAAEFLAFNRLFRVYVLMRIPFGHATSGGVRSVWYEAYGQFSATAAWLRAHRGRVALEQAAFDYLKHRRLTRVSPWSLGQGFRHFALLRTGSAATTRRLELTDPRTAAGLLATWLRLDGWVYAHGQVVRRSG